MSNIALRVLLFFVGIPLLVALVVLVPEPAHLPFSLMAVLVSGFGAYELSRFFEKKQTGYRTRWLWVPLMGMSLPGVTLLIALELLPPESLLLVIFAVVAAILGVQVLRRTVEDFKYILTNAAANIMLVFYPGLFIAYVVRLTTLPHSSVLIVVFLAIVYFNDTAAYLAGNMLGDNARNIIPVSPNKSIPGFIGGFVISVAVVLVAQALFPRAFPGSHADAVVLGAVVGFFGALGDLVESAMKRSAEMKDSGQAIPGRGGFLDNIDSPIFAAPAFFYLYLVLFL